MNQGQEPLRWAWWLGLVVLVALAYANSLHGEFVYDDRLEVVGNRTIHFIERWRLVLSYNWSRPVTIATYSLNYRLGGQDPFTYHLVDVALQAVNAGLAMLLVQAWARLLGLKRSLLIGALAAALWAVHPLGTEAVAYVTGRSEQLCGTFYLGGLLAWSRWLQDRRWVHYLAAWTAVGVGAFTKEVAVTLPLALFLVDWLLHRRGAFKGLTWWSYLPGLAALLAFFALRYSVYDALLTPREALRPLPEQLLTQAEVCWRYLLLCVAPVGQSVFHDHPVTGLTLRSGAAMAAWLGVFGAAVGFRKRAPLVSFSALLFMLILLPSSSVVALRETMAEHRVYLSLLALCAPVAVGLVRLERPGLGVAAVLVLTLGTATHKRNQAWATEVALWQDATRKNPGSAQAWYALGDAFWLQRKPERARRAYRKSVTLDPTLVDGWNNLGRSLAVVGEDERAERAFKEALRLKPEYCQAHNNLGKLAGAHGEYRVAAEELQTTLRYCPKDCYALRLLGELYEVHLDQPGSAIVAYQAYLQECPDDPVWSPRVRDRLTRLTW